MFSEIRSNDDDRGYFDKKLIPRVEELDKTKNGKTIEGGYALHYKKIMKTSKMMYL
jgi:hypothetical protein